jgi:antirestriction protein ArdC
MTDIGSRRRDIAADITARILLDLERGVMPWKKPWDGARVGPAMLPRRATGEFYRGVNIVLLWSAAAACGYEAPWWLTVRQANALGARVRKGERGEIVVYYGRRALEAPPGRPDAPERFIRFLKSYVVFNAAQIDGLSERYCVPPPAPIPPAVLDWHERWFQGLDIARYTTRDRACYSLARDAIGMPPIAAFNSADLHAQTLDHEVVHASSAPHRCNRSFAQRYPAHAYAVEEIVAELGAAYLGAHLGLPPGHIDDHSAYIGDWIKALKHDRRIFFDAAAKAQAAVDWLLSKSPPPGALSSGNPDVAA